MKRELMILPKLGFIVDDYGSKSKFLNNFYWKTLTQNLR
jgi:hypothetical protein